MSIVRSYLIEDNPTVAFIVGVALAFAVFAGNEYAFQRASDAFATTRRLDSASEAVQQILHRLVDAESSQRGYLLTSRKDYLLPGLNARKDIESALSNLRERFGMVPIWKSHIDALSLRTSERLSELQETLRLHEQGRVESARELFTTDIGREKMQAVRESALALLSMAQHEGDIKRARVSATLNGGRIGIHAMMALSLLWFTYYLRKSAALQQEQRLHANDLRLEQERLESEVKARTEELRGLNERLQLVREDERGRVARTLHDELGAILTAAKLDLARLRRLVDGEQSVAALVRLDHLANTLDQGIYLKRRIMEELLPSALHNLGLREALEILAGEFSDGSGCSIELALEDVATSERTRVLAYRWVESALADVTQHAGAATVRLGLKSLDGDLLQVSVDDDGAAGASTQPQSQDDAQLNLRHRIEGQGGSVTIAFVPGRGSGRVATLPAHSASLPDDATPETITNT